MIGKSKIASSSPFLAYKFQINKLFVLPSLVRCIIARSLRDRKLVCSASYLQGSNFESCFWRAVSTHHPQEVLLAQLSLYVHKCGLKPLHFIFRTIHNLPEINLEPIQCTIERQPPQIDIISSEFIENTK